MLAHNPPFLFPQIIILSHFHRSSNFEATMQTRYPSPSLSTPFDGGLAWQQLPPGSEQGGWNYRPPATHWSKPTQNRNISALTKQVRNHASSEYAAYDQVPAAIKSTFRSRGSPISSIAQGTSSVCG
jgi:hypothetical protein